MATFLKLIIPALVLMIAGGVFFLISKTRLPARIRRAEEYLNAGDQQRASEIVRAVLKKKEDYVPARYLRAKILTNQKQYLLAIAELNGILAITNFDHFVDEPAIHYHLADLYHETQQWQREIDEFKAILKFNPDDTVANHRVGHVLYAQKRYGECREHLEKAFTQNPSLTDCLLPLGVSCFHLGDFENAEPYLSKSLEQTPDNPEPQFYLGNIYRNIKNNENAIKMFTSAKRDKRFFLKSLHSIAEIYYAEERYEDAITTLEEGLKKLTGSSDETLAYRYLLAECYERSNKITEALFHWQKIYETNSNYRNTKSKLDDYSQIMANDNQRILFTSSMEDLQPLITELIARLNFNIVSKRMINDSEYIYKALNIKRINEPQISIYFNRTTREITESQIADFERKMREDNCKSGIYMTTSRFSLKAKNAASGTMIQLYDANFITKAVERIMIRKTKPGS